MLKFYNTSNNSQSTTEKDREFQMKSTIKAIIMYVLVTAGILSLLPTNKASDSYIRDRIVMLVSETGGCSGVQVIAPSKKVYIMTAGHCSGLLDKDNTMTAIDENGDRSIVKLVELDAKDDLMLLTSPNNKGIDIASRVFTHELIHTLTHGDMEPTFRTDGELLDIRTITIPLNFTTSVEEEDQCIADGHIPMRVFGPISVCAMVVSEQMTTAWVVPGSSGGAALNEQGELIGIVSISDGGHFSGIVPLEEIKIFISDK